MDSPAAANGGAAESAVRLRALLRPVARSAAIVLLLVAWEAFARSGRVTPFMLPPFSAVVARIYDDAASGVLWINLASTLFRAASKPLSVCDRSSRP